MENLRKGRLTSKGEIKEVRPQIWLDSDTAARLDRAGKLIGANSRPETIRYLLRKFEISGERIKLKDLDGSLKKIFQEALHDFEKKMRRDLHE
jgi:hypothetical protein